MERRKRRVLIRKDLEHFVEPGHPKQIPDPASRTEQLDHPVPFPGSLVARGEVGETARINVGRVFEVDQDLSPIAAQQRHAAHLPLQLR